MENLTREIEERWNSVVSEVEKECAAIGREMPTIIAVSKTRPIDYVIAARDAGVTDFGENYAQEFAEKAVAVPDVRWHFIGHLQRRNAKLVAPYANMIHTVDSVRLGNRLMNVGFKGKVLVQLKISSELSKYGLDDWSKLGDLLNELKEIGLDVRGLMVIADPNWNESETEKQFRDVKGLVDEYFGNSGLYSAGMSGDWRQAVRSGSTHLRIGTAIFGKRL